MKKKDLNELKQRSISEIAKKIVEKEKEKIKSTLEAKMEKHKNVHITRHLRLDIAQARTILRLKQLSQLEETEVKSGKS